MSEQRLRSLPVLQHQDFVYGRLQGLVWAANGTFFPGLVQRNAGELVAALLRTEKDGKPLILNCHGIQDIDDHALGPLNDALEATHRQLIFTEAAAIEPLLAKYLTVSRNANSSDGRCTVQFAHSLLSGEQVEELTVCTAALENKEAKRVVKESFAPFAGGLERLSSTPILASGVFNARRIITNPQSFIWISLLLSERLEQILKRQIEQTPAPVRLLAVSLRASPFAAALGALKALPIEIVDHLGPKHKILEEYTLRTRDARVSYIFVGDFVIGGSELRVAQAYAQATGCSLDYALVIGTLLDPSLYSLGENLVRLVDLKQVAPEARYQIV